MGFIFIVPRKIGQWNLTLVQNRSYWIHPWLGKVWNIQLSTKPAQILERSAYLLQGPADVLAMVSKCQRLVQDRFG